MSEEGIKQLEDIFDLGDSDVDLEDVYSEDSGDASFEDKKEEINDLLQEEKKENGETKKVSAKEAIIDSISSPQTVENNEVIDKKESEKVIEKTEEEKVENPNILEEESDDEIDFDTTESFKAEESEKEEFDVKEKKEASEELFKNDEQEASEELNAKDNTFVEESLTPEEEEEIESYENTKAQAELESEKEMQEEHKKESSGHYWQLVSNDAKFNHFYKMKQERLEKFLVDGEVPYDAWREELIKSRVDLSSLVFDLDHLSQQMQQVQQHQYRVAEIRIRIIGQYNWCKRSLEFLRGKLAQIAYERPIEKFNGVVYDHLSDIEDYLQQLEVLKESSEIISKNLDKAAEVISRRVTVVMMEVKTDNKGTRYIPREGEEQESLGESNVTPMSPVNFQSSTQKEEIKEVDPDDEFIDECDSFEITSSKSEAKPKKGWDLIPGKKK